MKRRADFFVPLLFILAGLYVAFGPMLRSGLARMQTDPGDARHLNYVLEHGYRWATGWPAHREFWSPPVFFPEPNTGAFTENLLAVMPFYAAWRSAGFQPDTALQLWMLTVSVLNFLAFHLFLTRLCGVGSIAASFGAFLFAFGSPRNVQVGHQHLLPHVYTLLILAAALRLLGSGSGTLSRTGRRLWIVVFFAGVVLQLYACFYLAWLLGVAFLAALPWLFTARSVRERLFGLFRSEFPVIVLSAAASTAAVWPLAVHSLEAARTVGLQRFEDVVPLLPGLQAWLNVGPGSWLYGKSAAWPLFRELDPFESEKRLGLGLVTPALVLAGLWWGRRREGMRIVFGASATLLALITLFPGKQTLWRFVFEVLPGAGAIRAAPRIGLHFLIVAGLGLAFAVERIRDSRARRVLLPLAILVFLEQGQEMPSFLKGKERERVDRIVRAMPIGCDVFFYSPIESRRPVWESQLDAMWVEAMTGIPTANGYSSHLPPGWLPLFDHGLRLDGSDTERLRVALEEWFRRHGRGTRGLCWLKVPETP